MLRCCLRTLWARVAVTDRGVAAAELAVGLMIGLTAFAMLLNGAFIVYGRGAIRGALQEGVRAGSLATAGGDACRARIADALDGMLGAHYRNGISYACAASDEQVVATASGQLRAMVPGVPDVTVQMRASVVREQDPAQGAGDP